MEKYIKRDRVDAVNALLVGEGISLTKDTIEAVLDADRDFIIETVLSGNEVSVDGIGTLKFRKIKARENEREMISGLTGETIIIPTKPEHSRLYLKVTKPLGDEVKERTMGNPFK